MPVDKKRIEELEKIINSLPQGKEKDLWIKTLEIEKQFGEMSDEEIRREVRRAEVASAAAEEQLKLLEMSEAERKKEKERKKEEAKQKRKAAEKEWEEAIAGTVSILVEEDAKRRAEEARAGKTLEEEKTIEDLLEKLKVFLTKQDLGGCGAVLRKIATNGDLGRLLNYYGYPSNLVGLHDFFNEELDGARPIEGETAFESFLWQQRVYALEQDISSIAFGLNQLSLSFAVGRKARAWYQLSEVEHSLATFWAIKKMNPEVAGRTLGRLAYGFDTPFEKNNLEGMREFELGKEGVMLLFTFSDIFEKQLARKEFNCEVAKVLLDKIDDVKEIGVKSSFLEALENYGATPQVKPEAAETILEELS